MGEMAPVAAAVERGDEFEVTTLVRRMLAGGVEPQEILDEGLVSGMVRVGELFKSGELFLPEVLMAAKAMNSGMDLLKPHLEGGQLSTKGRIVLGTVQGDIHDIGKNIVSILLKGAGFETVDLGKDVSPSQFIRAAADKETHVIGMSALLTTTMVSMSETVEALERAGLRRGVRVLVGGAPVTTDFAREIGADAYASDALAGVELCNRWLALPR